MPRLSGLHASAAGSALWRQSLRRNRAVGAGVWRQAVLILAFLGGAGAAGWYWWPVLSQRFAGVSSTLDGDPYLPLPKPGDRQPGLPQLIPSQQSQADGELADSEAGAPARPVVQNPQPPTLSPSAADAVPSSRPSSRPSSGPAPAAITPVPDQPAALPRHHHVPSFRCSRRHCHPLCRRCHHQRPRLSCSHHPWWRCGLIRRLGKSRR